MKRRGFLKGAGGAILGALVPLPFAQAKPRIPIIYGELPPALIPTVHPPAHINCRCVVA